jgi:hypothetical protein
VNSSSEFNPTAVEEDAMYGNALRVAVVNYVELSSADSQLYHTSG